MELSVATTTPARQPDAPVAFHARADIDAYVARWRWLYSGREIVLGPGIVDEGKRRRIEKRLNFWRSVCGCQAGAFAFIAMAVWRIAFAGVPSWTGGAIAATAGLVLAAAIAGKLAALLAARLALLIDLARLGKAPAAEGNRR